MTVSAIYPTLRGLNRAQGAMTFIKDRGLNGELLVQSNFSIAFWRTCLAACGACLSMLVSSVLRNSPSCPVPVETDAAGRFFGFVLLLSLYGFLGWFNVLVWKAWRAEQ